MAPDNSRIVTNFLNDKYAQRWIGQNGFVAWPPRSLDLKGPWSRLFYRPNAIIFRIHKIFLLIAQNYKSFSTIKV